MTDGVGTTRRWVCLDIGEVLVDETRVWSTWADVTGVPRFTFMAVMGAAIAQGHDHTEAFARLGVDARSHYDEVQERLGGLQAVDLYPDVLPALAALSKGGYGVAVIGNQPANRAAELAAAGVKADVMVMSDALGVQKPSPDFFAAVVDLLDAPPANIAYVGDRVDNDVVPAAAAGMRAVWLRRGPWAALQEPPDAAPALTVDSLEELAVAAAQLWPA